MFTWSTGRRPRDVPSRSSCARLETETSRILKRMGWKIRFVNVSTTFTTSRYPAKEKEKGPLTIRRSEKE